MSVQIFRIPLFPLHHVLFPLIPLPLHIFEERYKVMIQECIVKGEPFGVVLIQEGFETGKPARPYSIGCTARVVAAKHLPEGRMEIVTYGEERFRLLEYREVELPMRPVSGSEPTVYTNPDPYLVGFAEKIEDVVEETESLNVLGAEARELFVRYLQALAQYSDQPLPNTDLPEDPLTLSFYIGAIMRLPLEVKQQLLSVTSTQERLEMEAQLLRQGIAFLDDYATEEKPEPTTETKVQVRMKKEDWEKYFHKGRN